MTPATATKEVVPRHELHALTGVRAVACLWVLLLHLRLVFPKILALVASSFLLASVRVGFLGVDLFFLLSGFILSYNYARPGVMTDGRGYARFLSLRFARIYPVHFFTLLLMVPLLFGSHMVNGKWPEWSGTGSLVANLFLVNGWTFPLVASWNEPAWSVSAEWLAYLAFPACLLMTTGLKTVARASLFMIVLFGVLIGICQRAIFPLSSSYGLLRIIFEFTAGCALFRLYQMGFGARFFQSRGADIFLLICLAAIGVAAALLPSTMPAQVWLVPVLALMLYALSWGGGYGSKLLSTPAAEFGGHASYAVYMVQFPCLLVLLKFLHPVASSSLLKQFELCGFYLLTICVVGAMTHLFVENPARNYLRRYIKLLDRPSNPPKAVGYRVAEEAKIAK